VLKAKSEFVDDKKKTAIFDKLVAITRKEDVEPTDRL